MAPPNSERALPGIEPVAGADRDAPVRQRLKQSRGQLQAYALRLESGDDIGAEEVDEGRYWLYEHLRLLGIEVGELLDKFTKDVNAPITLGKVQGNYIRPLLQIYDDLLTYFWNPQCLMEEFSADEVDYDLHVTIRQVRTDWERLINAIKEYVVVRQDEEASFPAERHISTSLEFQQAFSQFAKPLVGQVARDGFRLQHSSLAESAGYKPLPKRGRVLKRKADAGGASGADG
jgi:hypothetical protein